jgi:arsenate reductase (glutaredoxin)
MLTIYHNTMCSKSRSTLGLINEKGAEANVVEYLKTPPTKTQLQQILQKLNMKPEELVRKGEKLYKEKFAGKPYTNDEWLTILAENPILIERPIVVNGDKAIIGRPPEKVLEIL